MQREVLYRRFLDTGTDEAWSELVTSLIPIFARIVYRVSSQRSVLRPEALEDALQEALLKLHRQREHLRDRLAQITMEEMDPYVKMLAANATRDYWRAQGRAPVSSSRPEDISFETFLDSLGLATQPKLEEAFLYSEIDRAIGDDVRGRTAFWMYYRWGYKAREIASIPEFSLSEKGVESLLQRTAQRVRQSLIQGAEASIPSRRPGHV